MARRISDEPLATTLTADDVLLGNDGSTTKRFPATLLPGFNASVNVKDYGATGDGATDDTAAVEAAIAAADGGTVWFSAGSYYVPSLAYTTTAPLRLAGDGATLFQAALHAGAVFTVCHDLNVEGLTFRDGGRWFAWSTAAVDTDLARVHNCRFEASGGACVSSGELGIRRITITDNEVYGSGTGSFGFFFAHATWDSAYASGNYLGNVGHYGIRFGRDEAVDADYADHGDILIVGNTVDTVTGTELGVSVAGIRAQGNRVVVANNTVSDVTRLVANNDCEGIYTKGNHVVVMGNVLVDASEDEAQITVKSDFAHVKDNRVEFVTHTTGIGIRVAADDCVVADNEVVNTPTDGPAIECAGAGSSVVVQDNVVRGGAPDRALNVYGYAHVLVTGNTVRDINSGAVECKPIRVVATDLVTLVTAVVAGNVITNNTNTGARHGIYIEAPNLQTISHAIVKDNILEGTTRAITFWSATTGVITDADVLDNYVESGTVVHNPEHVDNGVNYGQPPAGSVGLLELAADAKPAVNVKDPAYGAVGDARYVTDGVIEAGALNVLKSDTAAFTAGHVGNAVDISGAGAVGGTGAGQRNAPHSTTISAYTNATTVTLAVAATAAVTGARVQFGTDDSAAIQAAIDAALAPDGPREVFVGPGNFKTVAALTISGSLRFRGVLGMTTITPTTPVPGSRCIHVTAPDYSVVELEDFTLQGPTNMPFEVNGAGVGTGIDRSGDSKFNSRFSLRRVTVLGTWYGAVNCSGGGYYEAIDSHFEGAQVGLSAYESLNADNKMFFLARGCTFTNPNGDLSAQGSVGIYIHPHVPYLVESCRFITLGRYGIYENGSPTSARRPSAVTNCEFVDCEIIKTETRGRTNLTGCTAKGSTSGLGSTLWGRETSFGNCTFENCGPQVVSTTSKFTGCTFINTLVQFSGEAGDLLMMTGCRFKVASSTPIYTGISVSNTNAHKSFIADCEFDDTTTSGSSGSVIGLDAVNHECRIVNCRFRSIRADSALGAIFGRSARLVLDGCEFDNSAGGTGPAVVPPVGANGLEGVNNTFRGTSLLGTYNGTAQQRMVRRPGVDPTAVGSADTIDTNTAAWLTYDTHVVSGSAAIATLSNPWVAVGAVRLVVAAGASWTTPTSGNITPLTTAARTPGSVVTLTWEPTAAKWLETGTGQPVEIGVALSDETTPLTTGVAKATIRAPFAFTLTGCRSSLTTASSSGLVTVDVNEGGATVLSTKLSVDATEKTSVTAATAAVISDSAIAADAEVTFDIDAAGTGATGLKCWLLGVRA